MSTFGYAFRPWDNSKAIADGPRFCAIWPKPRKPMTSIATFVSASKSFGRRGDLRTRAGRSTSTVPAATKLEFSCNFLFLCTGYYEYAEGYSPAGQAWRDSRGASCIRRHGPKTCNTTTSGWW